MSNNNEELRREFEQNYRRYLDNVYLFNQINEILLNNSELSLTSNTNNIDVQKLRQQFLRAISNTSSSGLGLDIANKSRLTDEDRTYLREKIGQQVDKELNTIDLILSSDDNDRLEYTY